ncbi:MAG: prepilin-type N-terminal cleavage/methylation domain-containing protein [Synergistaceae bacterium]|jgi:prepilin-type N-terminal cleavage/methylation domain-containing protein|nr:prepilin-type N-terminal cleavage/methylation domain-containing protein [Synergistaceae bacterium]
MRVVKRGAFSLVELLLVVVIMGIVGALILLNMSTSESIDAQTEAMRYVRSVHGVRSAWIAYMADRHVFLGVPEITDHDALLNSLDLYADKAGLADDVSRYGNIMIETVPVTEYYSHIFLGFDGTGGFGGDARKKNETLNILNGPFGTSYRLTNGDGGTSFGDNKLMLRVW